MRDYSRWLWILLTLSIFGSTILASSRGWGVGDLNNRKTRAEIEQNCPGYYQNPQGHCLGRTFRSYYLIRGIRGGGFGSGK